MQEVGEVVHYSHWAGQPDVEVRCGTQIEPRVGSKVAEGVYRDFNGKCYTFEYAKTTCVECIVNENLARG